MVRLIDADALKKTFNLFFGGVSHAVIAGRMIDEAETVDAVPVVHGQWVNEYPISDIIVCSMCGTEWNFCDNDTERFNYCPNCGAKMDVEEG